MKHPQLTLNLSGEDGILVKHLLPFVNLVCSKSDRDIAIQLLGYKDKQEYLQALITDKGQGEMLAVIIFLFMLDNPAERRQFFNKITFHNKFLESRLSNLCGFDENSLSVEDLNHIWNIPYK